MLRMSALSRTILSGNSLDRTILSRKSVLFRSLLRTIQVLLHRVVLESNFSMKQFDKGIDPKQPLSIQKHFYMETHLLEPSYPHWSCKVDFEILQYCLVKSHSYALQRKNFLASYLSNFLFCERMSNWRVVWFFLVSFQ